MTTDDDMLTDTHDLIVDAIWNAANGRSIPFNPHDLAAAVLPIVAEEVRAAQEKAWDEGHAACDRDWTFTADLSTPDEDREPWTNPYRETGDSDEHR